MRFVVGLLVLCSVLLAGMPLASAQTEGLAYREDTVFTITDDSVDVVTEAVMTNTTAERRSGNTIYYSYFNSFLVVVPIGAENLKISSRGSTLSSTAEELDDTFEIRSARIPSQLRSGQSRSFTVTYSLPPGEIRGDGLFFSNPAFHAFAMWSFSDPGTGSLKLRVPAGAEMSDFSGLLKKTEIVDGYTEWVPGEFEKPDEVFTFVTVTVDDALVSDSFMSAGQHIELRTWPGDDEWARFAKSTIDESLPRLEKLIGVPVPDQETLEITESVTPYFYGYGGWYNELDTSIEVGNELDKTVMIHELSHAWFNSDLFNERWVSEGLAEEFTWQVQNELGWKTESLPTTPRTSSTYATPLVAWGRFGTLGADDAELRGQEEYGYDTSWFVIRSMTETIGRDGMRNVLAAATNNTSAYPGEDPLEISTKLADWKRLLDLASATADEDGEQVLDQLFIDYVVRESDEEKVEMRRLTRDAYQTFTASDLGWRIPDDLRGHMEAWRFADADEDIEEAAAILDLYSAVLAEAEVDGLELSDASRTLYELVDPRFDEAREVLDGQREAIGAVDVVRALASEPLTTEEQWGIGEVTFTPYVALAIDGFAADDVDAIADANARLAAIRVAAAEVGATRILWAKIGGGALGGLLLLLILKIGRRRSDKARVDTSLLDEEIDDEVLEVVLAA